MLVIILTITAHTTLLLLFFVNVRHTYGIFVHTHSVTLKHTQCIHTQCIHTQNIDNHGLTREQLILETLVLQGIVDRKTQLDPLFNLIAEGSKGGNRGSSSSDTLLGRDDVRRFVKRLANPAESGKNAAQIVL